MRRDGDTNRGTSGPRTDTLRRGRGAVTDGGRRGDRPAWAPGFDGWSAAAKPGDGDEAYARRHEWTFRGDRLDWELEIPVSIYEYCTNRHRTGRYGVYLAEPLQEPFVASLADRLREYCDRRSLGDQGPLSAAVRFVQGLTYSPDVDDTGHEAYPKYATETLVHRRGDCEDGTILLGTLLRELGYDVAALVLPAARHMLLGVALDEDVGTHVEYEGTRYYTVETTGAGWDPGELPPRYGDTPVAVHRPDDRPVLVHEWEATPNADGSVTAEAHVANFGDGPADAVRAQMEFRRRDGETVARRPLTRAADTLDPGDSVRYECTLRPPTDRTLRGRCLLAVDGAVHDVSESDWR